MKDVIRRHYRFTGRVQGVGFRYRAQCTAQHLGLTGWVRNNFDDSVELEAQGPREAVNRLVPTLTATSRWIRIEDMTVTELPVVENERSFRVTG